MAVLRKKNMAHSAEHAVHSEHTHHIATPLHYLTVWGVLMVLLVITVGASFVDLHHYVPFIPGANIIVMLLIAVVKATFVVLFFMHVKDGTKLTWLWAGAGFLWFLILFVTIMDYVTRNWGPQSLGGVTGWE
jgi:cytochrome c oxidase subunit IV